MEFLNEHLTRQMDLIPMEILGEKITIIGAGAIGSFTALGLAKMGFSNITVFDHDTVDIENMNSQAYGMHQLGEFKVNALYNLINQLCDIKIEPIADFYTGSKPFQGVVISAVDSMKTRSIIWDTHINYPVTKMIIDARMGAEQAMLYSMNPNRQEDRTDYAKTLYTDENAVQERCTAKATAYTALMLSGLVCKAVKDALIDPQTRLKTAFWSIAENDLMIWKNKE